MILVLKPLIALFVHSLVIINHLISVKYEVEEVEGRKSVEQSQI